MVETPSPGSDVPVEPSPASDLDHAQPQSAPQPVPIETAAPGVRRWPGSPRIWLGAGAAVLTVAVTIPAAWMLMPDITQVQEGVNEQPLNPPVARAAPPPARPAPVPRKAAPSVQVAANRPAAAPAPAQAPPQAPVPQAASQPPSRPSADYIQLASLLSNIHRGKGGAVFAIDSAGSNLTRPRRPGPLLANGVPMTKEIIAAIPKLKGARDVVVMQAVARLEAGQQETVDAC